MEHLLTDNLWDGGAESVIFRPLFAARTIVKFFPRVAENGPKRPSALSSDDSIIYVATSTFDFGFGYLVALDSRTLRVINRVRLTDPASGLDATTTEETRASPTVGTDGDVYYGVLENPFSNAQLTAAGRCTSIAISHNRKRTRIRCQDAAQRGWFGSR